MMLGRFIRFLNRVFCCCFPQDEDESEPVKPAIQPIVIAKTSIAPLPSLVEQKTPQQVQPIAEIKLPEKIKKKISIPLQTIKFKKNRTVSNYHDNVTAALQLPYSNKDLDRMSNNHNALLESTQQWIKEHAARRVDLYFYLLIAIYNTKIKIEQGDTILQHGKGRKTSDRKGLTHASHSSLFPSLITSRRSENEVTVLLLGRHFMDSLNSTVELPLFANQFDSELEGKISNPSLFRQKSMGILRQVSNGELDPVAGFHLFFKEMSNTFDLLDAGKRIKNGGVPYLLRKTASAPKAIKLKMISLVKAGVFCSDGHYPEETIVDVYVQLLLRLKPEEIQQCQKNRESKNKIYMEKIRLLQDEIFMSKSRAQSLRY